MLLRAPESWPQPVVAAVAMVVLAVLDLAGAIAAKEAVERRSYGLAVGGAVLYLLLFWVYASSLKVAELGPVTFGWIVVLQIGVLLVDRFHYGTAMPAGKWVAVGVLIAAQAYLLLAPSGEPATADGRSAAAQQLAGRHVAGPRPVARHVAGTAPERVAAPAPGATPERPRRADRPARPRPAAVQVRLPAPRRPVAAPTPGRNASVSVP